MFGKGREDVEKKNRKMRRRRRRRSISRSMQRLVLIVAIVIFLAASLLNGMASTIQFSTMYDANSNQAVNSMKTIVGVAGGLEEYARDVIDTYMSLPEDVRDHPDTDEYRKHFEAYESGDYNKKVSGLMASLQEGLTMGDMYIAAVEPESRRLIYLIDADGSLDYDHHSVGSWEKLTSSQAKVLLSAENGIGYYETRVPAEIIEGKDASMAETVKMRIYGTEIEAYDLPCRVMAIYAFPDIASTIIASVFIVIYVVVLSILIIIIVLLTRHRIKRRLVKPINQITSAAEQYVDDKKNATQTVGGYFSNLNIRTKDELEELGNVMAQMESDISSYEQDLARAAAQQASLHTELSVATNIQANMLPDFGRIFRSRREFSIFASMDPAKEVGGDFYDCFMIDDDHLGMVIADVSGKGIPAALFMMSSMIIINNYATLGFSPKEVLEKANDKICAKNVMDMFVTVWFGILDLKTGEVKAANAGHEYPAVMNSSGSFELLHDKHGLVVGAMEGVKYREYTFNLEKGAAMFVYTDGVAEATDANDTLYGTDRMLRALNAAKDESVEGICRSVREDMDAFVKDAPQFDDITMVCVRYNG